MIAALLFFFAGMAEAAPLPWFDLEVGQGFRLTQEVVLSGNPFKVGTRLRLDDKEPLSVPGAPMSFFSLYEEPCENPGLQSEMEIIVPEGNLESSAVGVELSRGCAWGIYVEEKDAFTQSFFEPAP